MAKKPSIQTMVIEDPYKIPVTSPLSAYLASQVGKGLPRYGEATGKAMYEPLDPQAYKGYQDFLAVSPGEWYTKGVQEPTMKAMREQIPLIEEGWAGSLRGSGRYRDVEDYMGETAETLAEGRYQAELQIPQAQFGMAQSYSEMRNKEKMLEYTDWLKSLPEMNPNLERALQFLAGPSGRDVITYQTAGQKPGWEKWIEWNIDILSALMGGSRQGSTTQPSGFATRGGQGGQTFQTSQFGQTWSPYLS